MRTLPRSFLFFVATGVVFVLQAIPVVGIFLMLMLAMFWSVVLINAGMIGTAIEAATGRVSRWWLLLPLIFYGGYWSFAALDHQALRTIGNDYDAADAHVSVPFDPARQALVFEGDGADGSWFVQNYNLPVAYSRNTNYPEAFRSSRMMASAICKKVSEAPALRAAAVYPSWFHDGDAIDSRKLEKRFCELGMPERPTQPLVTVAHRTDQVFAGTLPVSRVTTTVTTPNGRRYILLGGTGAPLSWVPMPAMGCALNSGRAKWECEAGFMRNNFRPIVTGDTRYSRDSFVLAAALGLKRIAPANRRGGDATLVMAKIAEVEAATLTRQLAAIDAMIADPLAKVKDWDMGVVASRPEALASRAEGIMRGIERAAPAVEPDRYRARESGRILAGLLAKLPRDRLVTFGPRILALYREHALPQLPVEDSNKRPEQHWLWENETLIRRLGDLGATALPVLVDPRASVPNVNGAGIEGLCRVGSPARAVAAPILLANWKNTGGFDRDERRALFVAMRRIGITPPPLAESADEQRRRERANAFGGVFEKQRAPMDVLTDDWGDVTPASPPRVCSVQAEDQARREEKYSGERKTNLE